MQSTIPADVNVQVVIAGSESFVHESVDGTPVVAVLPDYNDWNDYSLRLFAKLLVVAPGGERRTMHLKMMFEGHDRTSTVLDKLLSEIGQSFPIEKLDLPFVTMLPEEGFYRTFIELLGFDAGVSALRKLGDAVVARAEGVDTDRVQLTETANFHIGGCLGMPRHTRLSGEEDGISAGRYPRRRRT